MTQFVHHSKVLARPLQAPAQFHGAYHVLAASVASLPAGAATRGVTNP